jgi:hypothetical protein
VRIRQGINTKGRERNWMKLGDLGKNYFAGNLPGILMGKAGVGGLRDVKKTKHGSKDRKLGGVGSKVLWVIFIGKELELDDQTSIA